MEDMVQFFYLCIDQCSLLINDVDLANNLHHFESLISDHPQNIGKIHSKGILNESDTLLILAHMVWSPDIGLKEKVMQGRPDLV